MCRGCSNSSEWEWALTVSWVNGFLRTELDRPVDRVRQLKLYAVNEDRKVKNIVATFIADGLATNTAAPEPQKGHIDLPLFPSILGTPACEMTMEQIIAADQAILAQQDLENLSRPH